MATWPTPDFAKRLPLEFDEQGPRFQGVRLLQKSGTTFSPRSREDLEADLLRTTGCRFDCLVLARRLETVSLALNQRDIGKAAIATQFIDPPPAIEAFGKASVDDPEHPGWPRGAPDGKGGEFRPKDDAGLLTFESKDQRVARLRQRRAFRAILRRVLTPERAARMGAELVGDLIPGLDAIAGAATLIDDMQLLRDWADEVQGSQAALEFAEQGPRDLADLLVSAEEESFSSYYAFTKLDTDLDKRFGPAGDGYQYHHVVEQGTNVSVFLQNQLQSTSNIVKIPTLLHEEVNAIYAERMQFTTGFMSLRDYLRGASFERQRAWGLWALQQVGALKK